MSNALPMQSRIAGLSALENRLRRAFEDAEQKYVPPTLNLWRVTSTFVRLCRQGHLRLHEYYPLYAVIAIGTATAAVFGHRWLFAVYVTALVPWIFYLGKYVKQFAFERTRVLGLDRGSFGVSNLQLLVFGMMHLVEEQTKSDENNPPAPLTKENLASIVKLVKGGHEHREVGYGFNDAAKRWLFGGLASVVVLLFSKATDVASVASVASKAWQTASNDVRISTLAGVAALGVAYFVYKLIFSSANQKRRKRLYLLALNTIHETWSGKNEQVEACPQALADAERCRTGATKRGGGIWGSSPNIAGSQRAESGDADSTRPLIEADQLELSPRPTR